MSQTERINAFHQRMMAEEKQQRLRLSELVDETFLAYCDAGNPPDAYAPTQFFLNLLARAINDTPVGTYQRQGALLVAIRFLTLLVQHYHDQKIDPVRKHAEQIRKA